MKYLRSLSTVALTLLASVFVSSAQVGTGWTPITYTEKLQFESNDIMHEISPPPSHATDGYFTFDRTNGVDHFQMTSPSPLCNRVEIRVNDNYSTSTRQFQADVMVLPSNNGQTIHQVFNGSDGPYFLLTEETNENGSITKYHTTLATNIYNKWFRLNSINDTTTSNLYVYINGVLQYQSSTPGGTFYTKYGVYGTHTIPSFDYFKNVKFFVGGTTNIQDFTLTATPASQSVLPGNGTTYTVSATFTNTVNDVVYLSVSNLPSGVTASFSPSSFTGSGSSTLTVNTSGSVSAGTYTLTIYGQTTDSSYITHTTTVTLNVQDFSVSVTPGSQTVPSGGAGTYTATVTAANGFNGTVNWSASGLPSGATKSFNPTSLTGSGSSTMTVNLADPTTPSTYNLDVIGTSSGVSHSDTANLTVSDFSISVTPNSQTVTAGSNTTYTVNSGNANGYSGNISLSAAGYPSGTTVTFNPATITAGGSSTMTVSTTASTPAGTNTLTVTGTGSSASRSDTATLIVNAATVATTYEAEKLAISASSGDTVSTNTDGGSGGAYVQYFSNATNDYVQFTVPNVSPGTYTLSIGVKKYNNRGIVQVQVNKAGSTPGNIGSPVDLYSSSTSFTEIPIGTWTIGSQSDKWVKFLVTGKNAGSSGYNIAIDYIKLVAQ